MSGKNPYVEGTAGASFVVAAGAVLFAIAAALVIAAIFQLRSDAVNEARRDIANLALVLGEQSARAVQTIDLALRDLQDSISESGAETADALSNSMSGPRFHRELQDKAFRLQHAEVFAIVDGQGHILNSSRETPSLGADVSRREYFQHFKSRNDPGLFVSAPTQDRISRNWVIFLARRITSIDGTFLGVIVGTIAIQHFQDIYAAIDLPRGESFILARRDGTILLRHPDSKNRAGESIPASAPWHQLVADGGGFYNSPGYFDGIARMVAVYPIRDFPLVVNAAVSEPAVLATWRRQAIFMSAGSLLVLIYAAFLAQVAHRQFSRLANSKQELRAILETMDQGLLMVDARGILVHCNQQARRLLDLPDAFAESRPSFTHVLTYQWEINQAGREDGGFENFCRKRLVVDRPGILEISRPDGRIIEVRSVPMEAGGFVRTYTDITVRKSVEAKVEYLAHHDDLTRLVNRVSFRERLQEAISMSHSSRRGAAILYIDLDRFKNVNDTRGHDVGDHVLAEVAQRMRSTVRAIDTVARLGGDEFAIILPFIETPEAAANFAKRLVSILGEPYVIDDVPACIGASIGIATFPQDGTGVDELVRCADNALYEAKRGGRNTFRLYKISEMSSMSA